tara:strand:+ start:2096 stop:2425 length:330 start_codon:yes stop_codon:yes gene_type:complete
MDTERKVWENTDLVRKIVSYVGQVNQICNICGKTVQYQILDKKININKIKVYSLEKCERNFTCSEECLKEYNSLYNNKRFCMILCCIVLFIILVPFFVLLTVPLSRKIA